ncbi:peptidoglycan-binding domain-containing protein [Ruegeria sp. HKCCSP335]|uniref:peptidoglycan-binding domain-containing protein n=1 Tax=Ruegeria sp. HKCCSP335 TaxID=2794833 RepID=UPI001AEB5CAC|nr:peptidoglycan-binding domain-containing protein [Ruegeria sp. HKCCSP335]
MTVTWKRGMTAAALLATTMLVSAPAFSQELDASIETLKQDIAQTEAKIGSLENPDSLVGILMQSRLETTRLTLALVENQKLASEGAGTLEIVVPSVQPDPEKAAEILKDIVTQQGVIAEAEKEVANSGGLVQAVAMSRVQAEKLLLSQLNAAWYQAKYGISLPMFQQPGKGEDAQTASAPSEEDNSGKVAEINPTIEYADPNYPGIDYSMPVFAQLDKEEFEISGWWGISEFKAEIDDSPGVFAINVSAFTKGYGDNPSLKIRCVEGQPSVIFDTDDFIMGDVRSSNIQVTYRIDEAEAQTTNWNQLTTNKGAGLFGAKAEDFLRKVYDAQKTVFRLKETDGETHSMSIDMSGANKVIDLTAAACGFSTLDLGREDYKAIQTMLNAGGYDAGTADGQWGKGSKAAMKAFQAANNLPETGAPDRETLRVMGLEF